jgi:hypothetical protein
MAMNSIKGKAAKILRQAGWVPDRDSSAIAEAFKSGRCRELFPKAEEFIRRFGGINVGGCLWIWSTPYADHYLTSFESRISDIVGSQVIPVASSNYLSDTCIIWLDEHDRFYAADEDGMVYLAEGAAKFFDVVLLDTAKEKPPATLQERLQKAYEWQ